MVVDYSIRNIQEQANDCKLCSGNGDDDYEQNIHCLTLSHSPPNANNKKYTLTCNNSMSDLPIINRTALEELRALDPDNPDAFLAEIINAYLNDTHQRLSDLEQCMAAGDMISFIRAAHTIKGTSANLGALSLRAAAEALEHTTRKDNIVPMELLEGVRSEFSKTEVELKALLPSG